jgi:hypothetical protein
VFDVDVETFGHDFHLLEVVCLVRLALPPLQMSNSTNASGPGPAAAALEGPRAFFQEQE